MLRDFRSVPRVVLAAILAVVATASCGIKGPLTLTPKPPRGGAAAAPASTPAPTSTPAAEAKDPPRDAVAPTPQ